ncbi:phosphate acetyltransferase [Brevibacterium luteolum]|uniref:Phosphate acetyltransferase n=1 Tax=Brevibacterium luteolum TaxID=199591 RepID=A0A849ARP1_9MICO|nr:phosphate acetyltransferase [Brevibacterium luteolum]MBM7529818.1 phosphate acetyltransferase [Brevibacterium luteolum]NNG78575.1 phosphate acetyltransferase [Brevibacterium luteolum]
MTTAPPQPTVATASAPETSPAASPGDFPERFLAGLIDQAAANPKHIILPEGDDVRVLTAAARIAKRDFCDLTILGEREAIAALAGEHDLALDLDRVRTLDLSAADNQELAGELAAGYYAARKHKGISEAEAAERVAAPAYAATMLVELGHADGFVSGARHTTAETIRPALEVIGTREGVASVSSVFLMLFGHGALVFGDCAVNPQPGPDQLAEIAAESAATARSFGLEPKVAMLSYATGASGAGEAVDAVSEATAAVRRAHPDLPVVGPIQYDAAVHPDIAAQKLPGDEVAGRANVLIFPSLEAGNITYKAVQQSSGAVAVGPVLQGLAKAVNDLSRGCTVEDIVTTVAVTAVQAQHAAG